MEKLKKLLKRPVRTKQTSTGHFFQTYVTLILHHLSILEELKQKRWEILAHQRINAVTKKKKPNKKAQTMKATAADRTHHHLEICMNKKRRSNEHYQRMICGTLERMKQKGMMEHSTTIDSIYYQVQLNTKYNDEDYKRHIRSLLLLAQKTVNVHREVNHLYSLQNIIDPADIDTLYPVNLATRLHQDIFSQSCWIQRTWLAIHNSLNITKKDLTHPIWSAITRRYTPTQFHLCAAVSCALNNLREKTTHSINPLKNLFLNGIFDHAKSLELFLALLHID